MRLNLNLATTRAAVLILAVATGCSASVSSVSTDAGDSNDSAARKDTRSPPESDAGRDGKASRDTGTQADGAHATDGESKPTAPTVLSTTPLDSATGVALNAHLSATFSEPMGSATLTGATFTLTSGSPAVAVAGSVVYATSKAVFWPTAALASNTSFTATITTGAMSASGLPIGADYTWSFTTGSAVADGVPVHLGTAGQYVILAETAISTVSPSVITGDIGISPAAATYITGFSLMADSSNVFATSSQVTGKAYAADYVPPTPVNLTTAIGDMGAAFTAAAGRAPDVTGLGAGSIGGMTLPAGVYGWGSGLLLATDVTLTGSASDVWIFQVAKNLTVSDGVHLVLAGGAQAQNVFWQVSGDVTLGTTVQFDGTILCKTGIALQTGASITGALLAQTAVTLDANTVVALP